MRIITAYSGARLIFSHPALIPVVVEMLKLAKVDAKEAQSRIVVVDWLSDVKAPKGLTRLDDLLGKGSLTQEEKFDGPLSDETVLLCYSSGTTGKPKGVEVCLVELQYPAFADLELDNTQKSGGSHFYNAAYTEDEVWRRQSHRCPPLLSHLWLVPFLIL